MGDQSDQLSRTHAHVQEYYGKKLQKSDDLKTKACSAGGKPHPSITKLLRNVPDEVASKFYGCGAPLPLGIEGLRVLDLGSGAGRDCYLAAALVGELGRVVGVDMTQELIQVAEQHAEAYLRTLGYAKSNMRFVLGNIEHLDNAGIPDESVDIIISNCVINLCPDKQRVFSEAYRVLAPGGEVYFSDMYATRRLSAETKSNPVLWGEGISGAMYTEDFFRLVQAVGFTDPRVLASSRIEVKDTHLKAVLGNTQSLSRTIRLFKLPGMLETTQEDYGHTAIYKGTIEGLEQQYTLDQEHEFEVGKPVRVSGNTAAMLGEGSLSWLTCHFQVVGDRTRHYGLFSKS